MVLMLGVKRFDLPEQPNKEPVDDFGIRFISSVKSWDGCIVKFWMHDKGWGYQIDGALLDHVKKIAVRSPGGAFNFCKKVAINTYGPYDTLKELSDG